MEEAMEYTLVTDRDYERFMKEVNKLLKSGWRPQGGISVVPQRSYRIYFQAMIKEN